MEANVEGLESSLMPQQSDKCYASPINSVSKPAEFFSKWKIVNLEIKKCFVENARNNLLVGANQGKDTVLTGYSEVVF